MSRGFSKSSKVSLPIYRAISYCLIIIFIGLFLTHFGFSNASAEGPSLSVDIPDYVWHTKASTVGITGVTEPSINVSVLVYNEQKMRWKNTTSEHDGSFNVQVELYLGRQNFTVIVEDQSGYTTNFTHSIVYDITPPYIHVRPEYLNSTQMDYDVEQDVFMSCSDEIVINGTHGDDFSSPYSITVSVNGDIWWNRFQGQSQISMRVDLVQGLNILNVTAIDWAGNIVFEIFHVFCDSIKPPIVVTAPDGYSKLNNSVVQVTGSTEPNTTVRIHTEASVGSRGVITLSKADGCFSAEIQLYEGIQELRVTAIDALGNENTTHVDVVLDTTPPEFDIIHPPYDGFYTKATSIEIAMRMWYECMPMDTSTALKWNSREDSIIQ